MRTDRGMIQGPCVGCGIIKKLVFVTREEGSPTVIHFCSLKCKNEYFEKMKLKETRPII